MESADWLVAAGGNTQRRFLRLIAGEISIKVAAQSIKYYSLAANLNSVLSLMKVALSLPTLCI